MCAGTSNSAVAVVADGRAQVLKEGAGMYYVPSVVDVNDVCMVNLDTSGPSCWKLRVRWLARASCWLFAMIAAV